MISIIGLGLYGYMSECSSGSRNGRKVIPSQLIVTSDRDIWVTVCEEAVTGFKDHELAVFTEGDYLVISSDGEPTVEDNISGLRVTGTQERSVYADDYLVSTMDLYSEFLDDGLMVYYEGEAEFELEMIRIGG